jgi:hypothetical protein
MAKLDPIEIPYAPFWVKEYIVDELFKYTGFDVVVAVPSSVTAIQDITKNYKKFPDLVIQYDKLFKLRRSPFYPSKCEQVQIYLYGLPEKVYQAEVIIRELLDRSDASGQDLNRWIAEKQSSDTPLRKNPSKADSEPLTPNVFFHDTKVFQLEEVRDLGEIENLRGYAVSKLLIDYDFHISGISNYKYT